MKLQTGSSYKTRDGEQIVTIKRARENGTNYVCCNADEPCHTYLESGYYLTHCCDHELDLVEKII